MDQVDRFSLLLLEPGEIYFCDHYVLYKPPQKLDKPSNWLKTLSSDTVRGRLKICSKSVAFDPLVKNIPILRFPLKHCISVSRGPSVTSDDELNQFYDDNNAIELVVDMAVEMLESNIIRPYKFIKERSVHSFTLLMSKAEEVEAQISQLHRASTLPPMDQNVMVEAITRSSLKRHQYSSIPTKDCSEEVVLEFPATKISPLVANPGRVVLSNIALYFEPFNNLEKSPVTVIPFDRIEYMVRRRFLLRNLGMEIFCKPEFKVPHLYLLFKETEDRDAFFEYFAARRTNELPHLNPEFMLFKWQMGTLSNFEYLQFLNSASDRSVNDLTQYPVFPWVIADYVSDNLDLTDSGTFRDLRKPIGALNEERLQGLKERCYHMPEPKFLYGSHYSTPGFVVYFLMRQHPQYMLCLQNGRFDNPDRMFNSLGDTWSNVTTNPSDFKELIPQFYDTDEDPDFLLNRKSTSFGMRQNGKLVWDVELPPWASSPQNFIQIMRDALESDHVSSNLHHWIDLIFGYKQTGKEAMDADNVFYHLCYEGAVDLAAITDLNERLSIEIQILEFGQIPKQIFTEPHPPRNFDKLDNSLSSVYEDISSFREPSNEVKVECEFPTQILCSNDAGLIVLSGSDGFLSVRSLPCLEQVSVCRVSQLTLSACRFLPSKDYVIASSWDNYLYTINIRTNFMKENIQAHSDGITCMDCNDNVIVTGSWDCLTRVWEMRWPTESLQQSSWRLHMDNLVCQMEHDCSVQSVALSPNGTCFASGTSEGEIIFWFIDRERVIHRVSGHKKAVNKLVWNPKGDLILSGSDDGLVNMISLSSGKSIWCRDFTISIRFLCWDGRFACVGGSDGKILCYNVPKETLVASFDAHLNEAITSLLVVENFLISSGEDKRICVWKKTETDE